jgi:hypothetical protein
MHSSTNDEEIRDVTVMLKKEMIFTIPLNPKKPGEVRQSIKGLIEYIEDRLNLTVERTHESKEGPKLKE